MKTININQKSDEKLWQAMPPIFVISLKKAEDRRAHIKKELGKFGLKFEFVDAVDGASLDDETIKKVYSKNEAIIKYRPLVKSEIGCAMSHISVWQKMLDENIDEAIILEDDAIILDNFLTTINGINEVAPKDWQVILLGYVKLKYGLQHSCQVSIQPPNKAFDFVVKLPLVVTYSTCSYLINQQGAVNLVQKTKLLNKPIDNYTGDAKCCKVYCVNPRCADVDSGLGSDINQDRAKLESSQKLNLRQILNKLIRFKVLLRGKHRIGCIIRIIIYKIQL